MSSSAKLFIFILLLPFFFALGHDLYLSYLNEPEKVEQVKALDIDLGAFAMTDTGWVWQNYSPDTLQSARASTNPDMWKERIYPILTTPLLIVSLIPFAIGCVFMLLAFILGVWPFTRTGRSYSDEDYDFTVYKHTKTKAAKYSRK